MPIDTTYRKILTETFLVDELKKGEIPSAEDITDKIESLIADLDLTKPMFLADTYKVEEEDQSSASQFNQAQRDIQRDLRALYKDMIELTEVSTRSYERWSVESAALEKRLEELEDRIQNLLLLTRDTEGYHSYLVDNFTDMSLVDRDETTATVDPGTHLVTLGPSNTTDTRIYLNKLDPSDVSFKVRSTTDMVSRNDGSTKPISTIFKQTATDWWTLITMGKSKPVTCELIVKLAEEPIALSKIVMRLSDSSRASPMTITPLYSVDNFNFSQLPTNTYTQEIRGMGTFQFEEIQAKWIKFVLIKTGPDPVSNSSQSVYQFGFKEIAFFAEGFDSDESQTLISEVLSVPTAADPNEVVEFSKVTVEVCERVETGTSINYFLTASNNPLLPVEDTTVWIPVMPIGRATGNQTRIIDFGDQEVITKGLEEIVTISHDAFSEDTDLINPAAEFQLLSLDSDGTVLDETIEATERRYIFTNSQDRILNYQIKDSTYDGSGAGDALTVDEDSILIFRNVGEKGLTLEDNTSLVRDIQRGWKFEDPYYITIVEIQKPEGITIDFGDKSVIIDDIKYTNTVGPDILTGRSPLATGIHRIKVHKDNWLGISPDLTTLEEIKAEDTLYPYNHKLLIEGYDYPTNYSNNQERIYVGVEVFASELMKRVSVFDLAHSVNANQWNFYALDRDAPDTHTGGNESTRLFIVKVDENNPDFPNERFMIRFNLVNQRYKYLRFRADLTTTNKKVSPALDSYKIKLGG